MRKHGESAKDYAYILFANGLAHVKNVKHFPAMNLLSDRLHSKYMERWEEVYNEEADDQGDTRMEKFIQGKLLDQAKKGNFALEHLEFTKEKQCK